MTHNNLAHGAIQGRMQPIIDAVLRCYQLERQALDKPGRAIRAVTEARWVCCWLAQQLDIPLSSREIAAAFGQGQTLWRTAIRQITKRRRQDTWLRENTDALLAELRA
jgi:chromosomal replication initiation ATPase DnaA